jgi:hypothetical protein
VLGRRLDFPRSGEDDFPVSERPSTRSGVVGYVIVLVGVAGGCTSAPQMATSMPSPKGA